MIKPNVEREKLAMAIQEENAMIRRVKRVIHRELFIFLIFALLFVWGWFIKNDPILPNVSDTARTVFKWIGLIGSLLSGGLLILSLISFNNAKQSLLKKIDKYNENK